MQTCHTLATLREPIKPYTRQTAPYIFILRPPSAASGPTSSRASDARATEALIYQHPRFSFAVFQTLLCGQLWGFVLTYLSR